MRLAHCSDLHLLSHDGARWIDLANKRWIGALNLLSSRSRHYHVAAFDAMITDIAEQGIDHVLCTGDITNIALRREFEFARAKFDKLPLGTAGVSVVPGNHDAYVAEGVPLFAEFFGDYATTDAGFEWGEEHRQGGGDDLRWPIVHRRGPISIVGLSTSRQTPWFTAYGRIGEGQLARLAIALADPRLAGTTRIVAIHHPPAGKRAWNRIRGLKDHARFAEVIAAAGADLIVHGHEHRDLTEHLPGPAGASVPVRGVASGTYFHNKPDRTARYRIFDIDPNGIRADHVRIWDPQRNVFTEATPTATPVARDDQS